MRAGGTRTRPRARLALARGLAALVLAVLAALAPVHASPAQAATDGLDLTTAATYTIVPASRVVHVALDVSARNNKPDTTSGGVVTRYFYGGARLAIQPEARNFRATEGASRLTTTTTAADGYTVLEMSFRASLFYQQSIAIRVTFDLPGGAPRSASGIRVGTAFVTFVAWAFGDSGSVQVVVPAGFDAATSGAAASRSTVAGATVFRAGGISDIRSWYLVVNADRPSALTADRIDLAGGEHLVIRAWPEDAEWRRRVRELLTRGLPELARQMGLDWPVPADLSVFEVHTPLLEGYAGVFVEAQDKIEISEDLDDLTILHEASHAWFNSNLFVGRWIDEGLADTYAAKALDAIGSRGWAPNPVSPTDAAAVRLADWVHPGRITDAATDAREQYGYEASWTVVRSIVAEVGDAGMRQVLEAARSNRIAYVGGGLPEVVAGPNDWRRFLDLLDEVGGSKVAGDMFRRWVLNAADTALLDARAAARAAYAALTLTAADWPTPFYVRGPMSDWDFSAATTRIAAATALIARRDEIAALAATLGVEAPTALRTAYETARDSFDEATRVADGEIAALRALQEAASAVAAARPPLVAVGLVGSTPEADLAAARAALNAGSPDAAARAQAVSALIRDSLETGRSRLVAAAGGLIAVTVLLLVTVVVARRRRRLQAAPRFGSAAAVVPAGPYATLADQSVGPLEREPGGADRRSIDPSGPEGDPAEHPPVDRGDPS